MNAESLATAAGQLYPHAVDLEKVRAAHRPLFADPCDLQADGNAAAAYACAQMWRCILFAGFPITPSTKWLETLAGLAAEGRLGTKHIKLLEAEHAVADYLAGAAGACRDLCFATATSSVGLDHMTESLRSLGASGLGNLLCINVYRATANYPLCIEGDPSDALAHRDDGWIQICCRGAQQIYDTIVQAPCLGMHPSILTPVMPGYFGIKDSHCSTRLHCEADGAIHDFQDRWIAAARLPGLLNGDTAMGNCVTSDFFQGFKINQRERIDQVMTVLPRIGADFAQHFQRPGLELLERLVWPEDNLVDLAVIGMGPDMGTAAALADIEGRRLGLRIGVLAVRLLTPFPAAEYARYVRHAAAVLVVNHAYHHGAGHLSIDLAQACYGLEPRPTLIPVFTGMGGAAVSDGSWRRMFDHAYATMARAKAQCAPVVIHEGVIVWPSSAT